MFRTRRRAKRQPLSAGFTLLEALIALSVVAVSLVAIGSLMATTLRGTRSINQHLVLVATARAVLSALPDRDVDIAGLAGTMGGHAWRIDTSQLVGPSDAPRRPTKWVPQSVVLRIQAPDGPALDITTVRLRKIRP